MKMTHEEKINYMNVAASIVGYKFEEQGLDMLVSLYELIIEKKEASDLKSICKIQVEAKMRADDKKRLILDSKISQNIE